MNLPQRTRQYWVISSSWRGRDIGEANNNLRTCGEIMAGLQELGKMCTHFRLQGLVFGLLNAVIEGKRNRKRKPIDNVVQLRGYKGTETARVSCREPNYSNTPKSLVGM